MLKPNLENFSELLLSYSLYFQTYVLLLGVRIRIMPRARYILENSMNNHVILKGVDVEVMKVIQLASELHN